MIRGGPNPYDGLPDLSSRFCRRIRGLEVHRTSTVVELVAPLAVRFDLGVVASSSECITVGLSAAAETYVEEAEIAWTVGAAGQPPRSGSLDLRECEWAGDGGTLRAKLDLPIQRGESTARLLILIGNRVLTG